MPPQVSGPSPGKRPVVVHSHDGVNETKSGNSKKTPENQHNATDSNASHRGTPKKKSQKNLEKSLEISGLLNKLGEALSDALKPFQSEGNSKEERTTKGGEGQGSWMTDLAKALGESANQQAEKVKGKAKTTSQSAADAADLKAESQVLSVTQDAINNAVKSIGEAVSNATRK